MTTDAPWSGVVAEFSAKPGVTVVAAPARGGRRSFGSTSLRVNNKVFAMIASQGRFVLKLPGRRVDDIVSAGAGEAFRRSRLGTPPA